MRRYGRLPCTLFLWCCVSSIGSAHAWEPQRPVRFVTGVAGGVLDITVRQLAERISPGLRQPVIVDNRGGAGGIAMMETLARATADGHTLGVATFVEMTVNPWLWDRLPYDPLRDFAPITVLFTGPQLLVAAPDFPVKDVAGLIRAVRNDPGRFQYGSSGVARPPHIFMEKFKLAAGLTLGHVPYRGGPPLMQAVMSREVAVAMEGTPITVPLAKSGKVQALAVTGLRRLGTLPTVPTFAESDVPGIGLSWVGAFAPRGTPEAAVSRLHREIVAALRSPEILATYAAAGRDPVGNASQELAQWVRREREEWREVVRAAGIKAE